MGLGRISTPSVTVAACILAAGLLGGCGDQSGVALARQACAHVDASIRLYEQSLRDPSARQAAADRLTAVAQLDDAEQPAADATSADAAWNPLMTTIREIDVTDEGHLVSALRQQCALAQSPNPQPPVTNNAPGTPRSGPSTLPGQ
jgi:hypothetical protein